MSRRGCGMIGALRTDRGIEAVPGARRASPRPAVCRPSALDRCSFAESFVAGRVLR
jgi:hypothetical protein